MPDTNPKIRYGTFGGKNISPTSIVGTAQLAPKNTIGISQGNRPQFVKFGNPNVKSAPDVSPDVNIVGSNDYTKAKITTDPSGTGKTPNTGDSEESHVTPDPVFLTPEVRSRLQSQWEGNVTGNTIPYTIGNNLIQKIRPQFGISPAGSLNGNG